VILLSKFFVTRGVTRPPEKGASRWQSGIEPVIAAAELIRACSGVDEAKAALDTAGKVAEAL
jgi:hypothetical protein